MLENYHYFNFLFETLRSYSFMNNFDIKKIKKLSKGQFWKKNMTLESLLSLYIAIYFTINPLHWFFHHIMSSTTRSKENHEEMMKEMRL